MLLYPPTLFVNLLLKIADVKDLRVCSNGGFRIKRIIQLYDNISRLYIVITLLTRSMPLFIQTDLSVLKRPTLQSKFGL